MASTLEVVERATGRDKFTVLAVAIDHVAHQVQNASESRSLDDEIATLDVEELASANGVSFETFRRHLREALGARVVFRLGKRWVIRKRRFLDYLRQRENQEELSGSD